MLLGATGCTTGYWKLMKYLCLGNSQQSIVQASRKRTRFTQRTAMGAMMDVYPREAKAPVDGWTCGANGRLKK